MTQRERIPHSCLGYKFDKILHIWKEMEKSLVISALQD